MKLNLQKPLVIFDLETTGLDLVKDRIIQISYIKVSVDGTEVRGNYIINPEKQIPQEVEQLTGITNEQVKDKPTFRQLAGEIAQTFAGSDIAGFNSNHFDVPLLAEEFLRAGIDFDFGKCRLIDAQTIFHKMERRNLAAAYKFYCGRRMEDDFEAHRADQDTEATYRVLMGELDRYTEEKQRELGEDPKDRVLQNDVQCLADFSKVNDNVDFAGRMVWATVNGQRTEVFNFGKYKGMPVAHVLRTDPGYYSWILGGDFTYNTKQALTRIRLRETGK